MVRPLTLPVVPLATSALAFAPLRHRGPFPHTARQRRRFPDPKRLPPMSPLPPYPFAFAPEHGLVGCHWCLGLAALAQRPTRVCSQFLQARLHHLAGYSPELGSHTPPIDFCSCQDFRARPRTSRLRPASCDETNPIAQEIAPSLRRGASRVLTAQGSLRTFEGLTTPATTSVTPIADLPQPVPTQTPVVAC
jgi:hypothetical protein